MYVHIHVHVVVQSKFSLFILQESLKKVLQEKLEAIQKLTEIEVSNTDENKLLNVPEYSALKFHHG